MHRGNNSLLHLDPSVCGVGQEDPERIAQANLSEGSLQNLSVHCWLHLLSRESAPELNGESANMAVRVVIALVYLVVCALGLVGNLLALFLLHSLHRGHHSSVDFFVMNLAVTDLQFILTLPFWAVDTALDFRWPFGRIMCKIVSSVTTVNMYASVFFLTAMSVARYCSLAFSLRMSNPKMAAARAKWASLAIWAVSLVVTMPHAFYSTTAQVSADDELCLVRFSGSNSGSWDPQVLLGLYQTQKVLLGFVVPLVVISMCYLLLLRFVLSRRNFSVVGCAGVTERSEVQRYRQRRRSKVTRSVTIVVLSFFLCWLPNQALTLWGVLIKFDLVPFSKAFYNAQAYAFPLSVCLAHTNSCLNPVLYCLIRREYRAGLKELLLRVSRSIRNVVTLALRENKVEGAVVIPRDVSL
ncbi:relaxin-3 receptor 1 [Esox lucius]|uniref:G-protein coupled receptors family 1 profile domain-containing protein n=1 Tax=Esox lucius TaxID=8010 RepID=A0A3P8XS15_ESOLU|nr:relaxin-3 receptor 1 [Esox lucius]XP_019899286.1 relaxin-3 receptor 1 [Esox lucius]